MSGIVLLTQWLVTLVASLETGVKHSVSPKGKPSPSWDPCSPSKMDYGIPKTAGDNGFIIKIAGVPQPLGYQPDQVYTVSISSTFQDYDFQGFSLTAVPIYAEDNSLALGTFQILEPETSQLVPECPHVVIHTQLHSQPLQGVSALWVAPPTGSGCVEFRATVIQNSQTWFRKDGALTRVFCEVDEIELHEIDQR